MNYTNGLIRWYTEPVVSGPAAIAADALAELHGGTVLAEILERN
jgi:hypothetical protein